MENKYTIDTVVQWFGNRGTEVNEKSFLKWEMNREWLYVIPNQKNKFIENSYMESSVKEVIAFKLRTDDDQPNLYDEVYDYIKVNRVPRKPLSSFFKFSNQ
jgi:hypothetical protein